ncbi:lipid-A-disaccharide synthase [Bryobacterales bacterium F-183]|nr:lipid-A-disaccharide synthase [Bryobacterales bacterium F-183]
MRAAGVRPIIRMEELNVVGLVEVIQHIPRIYGEFRKLRDSIAVEKPDLAVLTDSPDFHLRLLPHLHKAHVPVGYFIAPQVWAWRKGRIKTLQRFVDHLLCIFPFEEEFFRNNGVTATYVGHPLPSRIEIRTPRADFRARFGATPNGTEKPLIALLPGSRPGEIHRHLDELAGAVELIQQKRPAVFVLGTPPGFSTRVPENFWKRFPAGSIQIVEAETWDLLHAADLALAASGTVTVEAALLGCPMVTYYKVVGLSWLMGKMLVRVPYYSMVNLVAGKKAVPEVMQQDFTAQNLCREALRLLEDTAARDAMKADLATVSQKLSTPGADPMDKAAAILQSLIEKEVSAHVS